MPTTADYLNDLVAQKNKLAQNLSENGVAASSSEKLNTLVPKVNELCEKGMQAFADFIQDYGNRKVFSSFCHSLPNLEFLRNFRYNFYLQHSDSMFSMTGNDTALYPDGYDLAEILEDAGISFTWGSNGIIGASSMFRESRVKRIPSLFIGGINTVSYVFYSCSLLKTIDRLRFDGNGSSNFFTGCSELENITFDKKWYASIDLSQSPKLTLESILSLFSVLNDISGTTTKRTATLGSTNLAKLTDEQKAVATDKGWTLA